MQQYRMHPEIASFPSNQFYSKKLITAESVLRRVSPGWQECPCFPPLCFWNTNGHMASSISGYGLHNSYEADFISQTLLPVLVQLRREKNPDKSITSVGIISFYKNQVCSTSLLFNFHYNKSHTFMCLIGQASKGTGGKNTFG